MRKMTLNIIQGYSHPVLKLSQYDKGYNVAVTIRKGVEAYEIPTDYTVTVEGRKPDNTGYQYPATFEGDTVTFPVMDQMTIVAGKSVAEVVFYDSESVRIGTANFAILVEPAPINEDVPISETDLPLIAEAVQAAAEAQASATTATAAATTASTSAESAEVSAEDSEAWAVGQRNGVDVTEDDPTYHNNAKWYAEQGAGPFGGVRSVNGQTGVVVLDADDVGALPDTTVIPTKTSDLTNDSGFITSAPVSSVNGATGTVVLTASDVGALPSSTSIPSKTSDLTNDSGFLTSAVTSFNNQTGAVTYTAPVTSVNGMTGDVIVQGGGGGAVDSVNGKTGVVVLTASDVGALPSSTTIPTKTSQLTNDSGFITASGAPVQSVNGATGTVVLTASDVGALPSSTTIPSKTSDLTNDSGFLTSAVTSFNGNTGAVTYTAPVASVNGSTGAVVIGTATTSSNGLMSSTDKTHLDAVYADYSSALTALGV